MPVRRCALADLEEVVEHLEKKNRIIHAIPTGGAVVILFEPKPTRSAPGARETRGAAK